MQYRYVCRRLNRSFILSQYISIGLVTPIIFCIYFQCFFYISYEKTFNIHGLNRLGINQFGTTFSNWLIWFVVGDYVTGYPSARMDDATQFLASCFHPSVDAISCTPVCPNHKVLEWNHQCILVSAKCSKAPDLCLGDFWNWTFTWKTVMSYSSDPGMLKLTFLPVPSKAMLSITPRWPSIQNNL